MFVLVNEIIYHIIASKCPKGKNTILFIFDGNFDSNSEICATVHCAHKVPYLLFNMFKAFD